MDDGLRFDSLAVRAENHLPNPLAQLEARLGVLEGSGLSGRGAWSVAFSSGRAALDALGRLLRPNDKVMLHSESSGFAVRAFSSLSEFEIEIEFNDLTDSEVKFDGTSLVFLENPTSATLTAFDLSKLASRVHTAGALLVVDNSILTMFACRPLEFAVDAVIYTSAAALTGDSTLALGAIMGRSDDLLERIRGHRDTVGARPNAQVCGSALRGLKTLSVRLERQTASALNVLPKLEAHAAIIGITYPNFETNLTRDGREMNGSLIAIEFAVPEAAKAFVDKLRHFETLDWIASAENTVCIPNRSSHRALEPLGLGLSDCLVRLSIGLEDVIDTWRVLEPALDAAFEVTPEPEPLELDEPENNQAHLPLPALDDVSIGMDNPTLDRFIQLRRWRDTTANAEGISRFLVLSNAILASLAKENPDSLEECSQIKGIGVKKLERYGTQILEILAQPAQPWLAQLPALENNAPAREKPNAVPVPIHFDKKHKRRRKKKTK
jgi:cystathionine beta-lyase/cystathionine gamma-synthase